jgi:hypothetical protein
MWSASCVGLDRIHAMLGVSDLWDGFPCSSFDRESIESNKPLETKLHYLSII